MMENLEKDAEYILNEVCVGAAEVLLKKDLKEKIISSLKSKKTTPH